MTVFISYSRKDMVFVDRLVDALQSRGFKVLIDRRHLPDLAHWQQELLNLIRQADTVVFVISPRSIESNVCAWEIAQIESLNKRLAPIVLERVADDRIPHAVSRTNYLFFDGPNDFASQAERLANALNTDVEWWREHTRLVGAAVRWSESGRPESQLLRGTEITTALSWTHRCPDHAVVPDVCSSFLDASIEEDAREREALNARERRIAKQTQRIIAEAAHQQRGMGFTESALRIAIAGEPSASELERGVTPEPVLRAEIAAAAHALQAVQCLSGHDERVSCVRFSPHGDRILTASHDHTARIWDVASGREQNRFEHRDKVNVAAFNHDGTRVLTGSDDHTARVWDAMSGEEVLCITHDGDVSVVAFSPDGRTIITASKGRETLLWDPASGAEFGGGGTDVTFSEDSSVQIWDLSGRRIARFDHQTIMPAGAFSRDSARILTTWGFSALVWDAQSGREIAHIEHQRLVNHATFDPSGTKVVTACQDGTALISDALSGAALMRFAHGGEVSTAFFNHDGSFMTTSSTEESARVWHVESGTEIARFVHDGPLGSAIFSPDGSRVLTAEYWKSELRLWDVVSGSLITRIAHQAMLGEAAFSPDGTRLVTASMDGVVRIWDTVWPRESLRFAHDGWIECAAFSPDNELVVTGSRDNTARVWRVSSGAPVTHLPHEGWLKSIAFSPVSKQILTASEDQTARIWDAQSGEELVRLEHDGKVNIATFSSDGRKVLTGADDRTARVWDAVSGEELARLPHERPVTYAAFSPDAARVLTVPFDTSLLWDVEAQPRSIRLGHEGAGAGAAFDSAGRRVVTTALDDTARVWDAASGAEVACLVHGDAVILSAVFSPDGAFIATAGSLGRDGFSAYVWDVASGTRIARLRHEGEVGSVAFSHDGGKVITVSQDGTARVWERLSGVEIARFTQQDSPCDAVLSTDGAALLTWGYSSVARLWDTTWAIRLSGDELLQAVLQVRSVAQTPFTMEELEILRPAIGEVSQTPFERWLAALHDDAGIGPALSLWRRRREMAAASARSEWTSLAAQMSGMVSAP